jgi:dihydroorotase
VAPGFIDAHVHLREPGGEAAETVATGSAAAARGGFTTVLAMPNTTPPLDRPDRVETVRALGQACGLARVLVSGCITRGRAGAETADLAALAAAGAAAFTDDGSTVQDDAVMRAGMKAAAALGRPVMDHAQDRTVELQGGVMHEGRKSRACGLPGIPASAEAGTIRRDIELARETGCRVHIQHVTSRDGVELIGQAREAGLPVSGELTPHHLALPDEEVDPHDATFKMNPPLRSPEDREALIEACREQVLEVFATDHAPHPAEAKARGFLKAPFGIVGLETAVGITYTRLVETGLMPVQDWIRAWTQAPAALLGLPPPGLHPGSRADLVVLDVDTTWTVDPDAFASRARNTPFAGWKLRGRAVCTVLEGRVTWKDPNA